MSADLRRHREGVLKMLFTRMEMINASIGHNLTHGEENEEAIRDLLASVLPSDYGIGSGIIVGTDGVPSKQMDIVIFDRTRSNLTLGEKTRLFFADQVLMAIEIKTTFSSGKDSSLESALKVIASLRQLKVAPHTWRSSRVDPKTGDLQGIDHTPSLPIGVIFFFSAPETSGPLDLVEHFRILKEAIDNTPLDHQPDILFSFGHASIFAHEDVGRHSKGTQYSVALQQDPRAPQHLISLTGTADELNKIKLMVDMSGQGVLGEDLQCTKLINKRDTSHASVVWGNSFDSEPQGYRVAKVDSAYHLLDPMRAFMFLIEKLEALLKLKVPSPLWSSKDYFGEHFESVSQFPDDFSQTQQAASKQ